MTGDSGTTERRESVDLVLEGGGVKGFGLLGAVLALWDAGYRFERIAGTSAGAIVAALVTAYQKAGRDLRELVDVVATCDYARFEDDGPVLERLTGKVGEGVEILLHEGAHDGGYLYEWLVPILEGVGVRTFDDLRLDDPNTSLPPQQNYALVVHTSDISRRALVRLPWDYPQYGHEGGKQRVADAVRASMSFPFFFKPVQLPTGSGTVTWVDGGLLSNFPITVFDRTDGRPSRWPTWGVKLSGLPATDDDHPVRTAPGLAFSALRTLMADWNHYALDGEGVNQRTIFVDTTGIDSLDFHLSQADHQKLFRAGQSAARTFLAKLPARSGH
ncbi:patatin-like phospholipase family protein [Streptantibioticus silvisoli]|uniref:Patatin-like phospholipase family protein n=1 Tax=Streptantibioticus silvisoli TaxID=2705255 RepID=A0ABT6W841_9ACTN|nr:patatin-like phospholipase family protein [Streptantibioticus silvisoli]MDI5966819.1 patatin-like phospholipase family protein [Streptantibioticus silvisoli]